MASAPMQRTGFLMLDFKKKRTDTRLHATVGLPPIQSSPYRLTRPRQHNNSQRQLYTIDLSVFRAAFAEPIAHKYHLVPFKRMWMTASGEEVRVVDELYTADAWINAHDTLQKQPKEPGCELEKVVAPAMGSIAQIFWRCSLLVELP